MSVCKQKTKHKPNKQNKKHINLLVEVNETKEKIKLKINIAKVKKKAKRETEKSTTEKRIRKKK